MRRKMHHVRNTLRLSFENLYLWSNLASDFRQGRVLTESSRDTLTLKEKLVGTSIP